MLLLIWWWCKKSSLLNNILLSCKQQKKIVLSGNVSECVHSFFSPHQLSCIYALFSFFFFSKSISLVSIYSLLSYNTDTMCNGNLWWWAFFSWCAFEGRKKELFTHKKKRANIFLSCTSSVFWITDIFSNRHPMQCRRVLGWLGEIDSLSLLLHNVRVLREFFVYFSFFYVLTFFSCFNFF